MDCFGYYAMNSRSSTLNVVYKCLLLLTLAVVSYLVIIHIIYLALCANYVHTDNMYNLALVRHSASGNFLPVLETSYLHWYFEAYQQVRAEDWHRSASLVLLTLLGRISGTEHTIILRIPHLLWMLALFATAYRIFRVIQSSNDDYPVRSSWTGTWFSALLLVFIILMSRAGISVFAAAFMDDIPAAVCTLLGFGFLLRKQFRYVDAAKVGICFGLAFWMKDFYLLWGPLGLVLIGVSAFFFGQRPSLRRFVGLAGLYCAVLLATYCPKLIWNYVELGQIIPNAASLALHGLQIKELPDGEHFFYFLSDKISIEQGSLFSSDFSGLVARVQEGWTLTTEAMKTLHWTWVWLGLAVMAITLTGKWRKSAECLAVLLALVVVTYCCFFSLGLGEPIQLRYWLVPISLASVLGVTGVRVLPLRKLWKMRRFTSVGLLVSVVVIIVAVPLSDFRKQNFPDLFKEPQKAFKALPEPQTYSPQTMAVLSPYVSSETALMLQTNRGVLFWARHPNINIVGVKASCLTALNREQVDLLTKTYNISAAMFHSGRYRDVIYFLKQNNFVEIQRFGKDVILVYKPYLSTQNSR